jgi:hypothetical protein
VVTVMGMSVITKGDAPKKATVEEKDSGRYGSVLPQ